MAFSQMDSDKKTKPCKRQKDKKLVLKLEIQTYQILKNNDEVCIPSLSSIILAVVVILKGLLVTGNLYCGQRGQNNHQSETTLY